MARIDSDGLQELIDSHGAALKLYARQWCNAPDDALQEALIELLRQSPVPDHPTAWLFKTIRFRAMNLSRGERRSSEHHRRASSGRSGSSRSKNLGWTATCCRNFSNSYRALNERLLLRGLGVSCHLKGSPNWSAARPAACIAAIARPC
jgi:hypothetical protein